MIQKELQSLLQHHYDRATWNHILESVFASVHFLRDPAPLPVTNPHIAAFHQTGVVRLADGKNIALFEVVVDENIHLLRNRVGVRNLMTRFINEVDHHGVLVVYDQGNASYRLTFVARESGFNEQGEWAVFETASKRFTYVLGGGETCRTAAERLALLAAKKDSAGLHDVIDAFSVERLSKEFFTRYKSQYQAFVDYLTASNSRQVAFRGDDKAIRNFVKKLLGRIVFLHFLQKKGWLGATDDGYTTGDRQFMQRFWDTSGKGETFYTQHLTRLFFDALNTQQRDHDAFQMPDGSVVKIPYLNGGLFDKDRHEPEWLTFPPELFEALFAFFGEYNFTIDENDPEEREVGIDPEMLGHIFENLLEDNKDKGAFYTPKEIVQYMTQESLIEYLRTGLERQYGDLSADERKALRYFIRYKLKGDELPQEELQGDLAHFFQTQLAFIQRFGPTVNHLLDEVKICDPAIGSGAFPMGLLNEMYHCKVLLNNTYTPEERAAIKRHIIENSIYGVDLEKGAVDIARLRFWLSLIVDEDTPTPLPNLDYKIVAGDSLVSTFDHQIIEIDWNDDAENTVQFGLLGSREDKQTRELLQRITEQQQAFFHANTTEKRALANDIRALKIDLLITQLEAMVKHHGEEQEPKGRGKAAKKQMERFLKTQGWKQAIAKLQGVKQHAEHPFHHFDWTLDFPEIMNRTIAGESTGFDIVIGNPPYILVQILNDQQIFDYFKEKYFTANYKIDTYQLFYEKSLSLYQFYKLTYEEVLLVDPNFGLSEAEYSRTILAEIS